MTGRICLSPKIISDRNSSGNLPPESCPDKIEAPKKIFIDVAANLFCLRKLTD
jgi:hypothetical protein